jgi:dynein heavy chain
LDALKERKTKFQFTELGEIALIDTVGFFITMNPGYAGRTELPENLKALFRSCAMVTPDLILICENMLLSEGFSTAKNLSKKFVTLYMLSRELLSKARHYDWGLRAVKSVLR